jgi:hypothetical protein
MEKEIQELKEAIDKLNDLNNSFNISLSELIKENIRIKTKINKIVKKFGYSIDWETD